MKTFNIKDDLKVIQFDGTFECKEILEEVFYDYAPIEWEWENNSNLIKLKDFPLLFTEVIKGDYILVSNTNEILMILDEEYFNKVFEVN